VSLRMRKWSRHSRKTRHTKTKRATKAQPSTATCPRTDVLGSGPIATIRLPVHPLYRERVEVVARYGRHALRVEQPDGQLRLLPVAWTDLVPRPAALALRGRRVRLAPDALRELGAWVAARISRHGSPEKLDSIAGDARELTMDAAPTDGAAMPHHDGETLTLVEQAGPPRVGRRGVRQKRGRR
jgi:hypothetical protein